MIGIATHTARRVNLDDVSEVIFGMIRDPKVYISEKDIFQRSDLLPTKTESNDNTANHAHNCNVHHGHVNPKKLL